MTSIIGGDQNPESMGGSDQIRSDPQDSDLSMTTHASRVTDLRIRISELLEYSSAIPRLRSKFDTALAGSR